MEECWSWLTVCSSAALYGPAGKTLRPIWTRLLIYLFELEDAYRSWSLWCSCSTGLRVLGSHHAHFKQCEVTVLHQLTHIFYYSFAFLSLCKYVVFSCGKRFFPGEIITCAPTGWLWPRGKLCRRSQKECSVSTNGGRKCEWWGLFLPVVFFYTAEPALSWKENGTAASNGANKKKKNWRERMNGKNIWKASCRVV